MGRPISIVIALMFPLVVFAACPPPFSAEGFATYYSDQHDGQCGFPAQAPGIPTAAINGFQWEGSAHCGECLEVGGPLGRITVRVTNRCPECGPGDLDLDQGAFAQIAPPSAGRVPISWRRVACEIDGNLQSRVLAGSNPWYLMLQADQHRHGIASAEARIGDAWQPLPRTDWNTFQGPTDRPVGSLQVRYVSTTGESIEHVIPDVAIAGTVDSGQQFAPCVEDVIFDDGFEAGSGD